MTRTYQVGDLVQLNPDRWKDGQQQNWMKTHGLSLDTPYRVYRATPEHVKIATLDGREIEADYYHRRFDPWAGEPITIPKTKEERLEISRKILTDLFSSDRKYQAYVHILKQEMP